MDTNHYKIIGFTAFLTLFFLQPTFSQTSLLQKRKEIDSVIISIIGERNFKDHVTFNKWRSKADKWGNQIKGIPTFETDSVNFIPDYYDMWYDLDLVEGNYLDDRITVDIDVNDSIIQIRIAGIPECLKTSDTCTILDQKTVISLSKKNGLKKGLYDRESRFYYQQEGITYLRNDSIVIVVTKGYYYWTVSNVLKITTPKPCVNGEGEMIKFHAISGRIIERKMIHHSCLR